MDKDVYLFWEKSQKPEAGDGIIYFSKLVDAYSMKTCDSIKE
tara:strand:- start:7706 stop:7831 length:126 start_codon:yes stop_codon:yes gene_type:complete